MHGDTRRRRTHRFEVHETKTFIRTRHYKECRVAVQRRERRLIDTPEERDRIACVRRLLTETCCVIAVADDDEPCVSDCSSDGRPQLDESVMPFVPLPRVHPADNECKSSLEWNGGHPRHRRRTGMADDNRRLANPWVF